MSTIDFQLGNFKNSNHSYFDIPDKPGNYIVCLNDLCELPGIGCDVKYVLFENKKVIYTGITKTSLRNRYYKQHFSGDNAGRSTLRLSLGVLLGYQKIYRDKDKIRNKYKFNSFDERELSIWMKKNLTFYYLVGADFIENENLLIATFKPPLNLSKNSSIINSDFRRKLSSLRSVKIIDNEQIKFQAPELGKSQLANLKKEKPLVEDPKSQNYKDINTDKSTLSFKSILKYIAFFYMLFRLIDFIFN